jgi:polyhydroxyalkanoate synthase
LRLRQSDPDTFKLGVNTANTPGKVVFRNDLIELIQYAPTTPDVLKRPLLIVPPWINKFYVLDLNADKSFVRFAVAQGLTVFLVSWVNPDARHRAYGFDAYMRDGIFAALGAIEAATGERDIAAIGYCVGGTLLASALAYMAAHDDDRISSATLFTAQTDFSEAGGLKVFVDEAQLQSVEAEMAKTGYLEGAKMANAFNMLRPDDLIWPYIVNNYLKGIAPAPFDLLSWNADSTRMTEACHRFYLRSCYLDNELTRGKMKLGDTVLALEDVRVPIYCLATREDHIAPARSVYKGMGFFKTPIRFVLAGSGHIAGVVNPPARQKYQYWAGPDIGGTFEDWLTRATEHPGSWWPDWAAWIATQNDTRVPAREPGSGALPALADAPGTYVRVKS